MKKGYFLLFLVWFTMFGCASSLDVKSKSLAALFKAKWKNSFSGYELRSRGHGKGLIVKLDFACKKDNFHRYQYDSAHNAFRFSSDEKFISDTCFIDVNDHKINDLISLFDEMALYKLVAIKNDYGIVQLSMSENETIYYIDNLDLPKPTKNWLDKFSKEIFSNFFYVKGTESIWDYLP